MIVRIAINGFGRIGRMVVRAANKNPNVEIVAKNGSITKKKVIRFESIELWINIKPNRINMIEKEIIWLCLQWI